MKTKKTVAWIISVMIISMGGAAVMQQAYANESAVEVTNMSKRSSNCDSLLTVESQLITEIETVEAGLSNPQDDSTKNNEQIVRLQSLFACYVELTSQSDRDAVLMVLESQERVEDAIGLLFESAEVKPMTSPVVYMIDQYSQLLSQASIELSLQNAALLTS